MKYFHILIVIFLLAGCATTKNHEKGKTPRDKVLALIEAAQASMIERDPIGALQYMKAAEGIEPDFAPIHHTKALAFHMRKDFTAALQSMKKCVQLDPDNPYSNNSLGKMLLDASQSKEAEKYLLFAANDHTFRESFKAKTNLGILYYRQGDLKKADHYFDKATSDDPVSACIAYYYRGHIAMKTGKLPSAVSYYERASKKMCAGFTDAHYALGLAYERNQQGDLAKKKYLEIKQNFPESASAEQALQRLKVLR